MCCLFFVGGPSFFILKVNLELFALGLNLGFEVHYFLLDVLASFVKGFVHFIVE